MLVFSIAKLGIKPTDHVVVYDSLGIFSAPRGAFTFTVSLHQSCYRLCSIYRYIVNCLQAMNHEKVSVLDGGLPRYRAEGHELDDTALNSEEEGLERARVGQVRCGGCAKS